VLLRSSYNLLEFSLAICLGWGMGDNCSCKQTATKKEDSEWLKYKQYLEDGELHMRQ
jgi:hypothetical protein